MDLPAEMQKDVGVSHAERPKSATEVRQVQNVALADATAKAGVSPWTKSMFKVSDDILSLGTTFKPDPQPSKFVLSRNGMERAGRLNSLESAISCSLGGEEGSRIPILTPE
jgi:hypothetical protein